MRNLGSVGNLDRNPVCPFEKLDSDDKPSDMQILNQNGQHNSKLQRKPSSAISEIFLTEQRYIKDLAKIVNEYIPEMYNSECPIHLPDDLKNKKAELIFGNIESLFKWHKDEFLTILQRCSKDPSKFGTKMEEIEKTMLSLYVKYFRNKPVSDYIVNKHESYFKKVSDKFQHSFPIKSYLQLPIDRIFKYKILFMSISKHEPQYEKELLKAIEVMERIIADVNDLMVLWRLEKFPEKIDDQGKLICHDALFCSEDFEGHYWRWKIPRIDKPKRFQVFLLEGSVIFANIIGEDNSFNIAPYEYYYHIKVSQKIQVERHSDRIQLKFNDPKRKDLTSYTIYTEDKEINTKWMQAISGAISYQEEFENGVLEPVASGGSRRVAIGAKALPTADS